MTDIPEALVEKGERAVIEFFMDNADHPEYPGGIARAVLAAVWSDLPAARPVVDRGALADEVAARIEGSQSPLRDVPQADMAYERAAQDARDAIHASENIQDRPGVCADRDALVGLIRRSAMLRATTSEGEWATRLADTILARLVVQDAADVRRAVAEEIAAAIEAEKTDPLEQLTTKVHANCPHHDGATFPARECDICPHVANAAIVGYEHALTDAARIAREAAQR